MMKVRVQYTAQLRTALGQADEDIELPDGSTLASLLSHLAAQHGHKAHSHFTGPGGEVPKSLLIVVNDSAKSAIVADATVLSSGDVVTLLPPIAGG
jgi:sulfur-carrier protein